jgi:predicted house-cleaning noncanonical NTP pyrophosphatase (MazG superfamily)
MKKLIRDKIPDLIKSQGRDCNFYIADRREFSTHLSEKLREEVEEFIQTPCIEELADILEVVYALSEENKFRMEEIESAREEKMKKLGGFKNRVILIY